MDLLHKLLLAGEITTLSIAGLVAISVLMQTARAIFGKAAPPFVPEDVPKYEATAAHESWPHRALVAFDIAFNVIVLRGEQDETISTHSWRAQQEGKMWGKAMCWWLDGFQQDHGFKAASGDLERATARVQALKAALKV